MSDKALSFIVKLDQDLAMTSKTAYSPCSIYYINIVMGLNFFYFEFILDISYFASLVR